jgi:dTMP kinase
MIEGNFIVIEGIDGSGTTTQAGILARWFHERGLPAKTTHEPTIGPVGALIRQALTHRLVVPGATGFHAPSWKTMALLFAADRLDHLEAEIVPNLMDGVTIISDRYDLSSLAYQSLVADIGNDLDSLEWIRSLNKFARRPDLTIVLDVPADLASRRRKERGQTVELYEQDELQARLASAYLNSEKLVPHDRLVHIDGDQPIEDVAEKIANTVSSFRGDSPRSSKRR